MLRKIAVGLAALGALNAAQVKALGLGEVTVHSALNQPLKAEIDLLQIRDLSSSQIVAGLAEADEFYLAGVKPTAILSDLSFELDLSSGNGKLLLKTREPIREPFLNFLVEINWPTGRLVKEYTLLLDPPVFSAQDLSPQAAPVAPVVKPAPAVARSPADVVRPAAPAVPAPVAAADGSYLVGDNETLWNIALKTRPGRAISPQQMMLAIQRANPDAFVDNNINRLRSGVVLDIPTQAEIEAMALGNSVGEVLRQNSAWRSTADAEAPKETPKSEQLDASGPAEAVAQAPRSEESQLRIVGQEAADSEPATDKTISSDTQSGKPDEVGQELLAKNRELEEQLVVTLEGLDKVERDNAELFARLERLSEQMESMQRLIELKDQQLAEMQNRAPQPPQAAPVVPQPEPQSAEVATSFVDTLMKSPATLGGIGAGLLALLGGLLWFVRKRRQDNEAEELAVIEAMAMLDEQEQHKGMGASVAGAGAGAVAATLAEQAVADLSDIDESTLSAHEDPNDPFNAISDEDVNEFGSLDMAGDLDMDLKIDEPVANDLDLEQFSESLLSDDDFDLSIDQEVMPDNKVPEANELDDEPLDDLDLVLGGDDAAVDELGFEEAVEERASETLAVSETDDFEISEADNLDSELEAILGANEADAVEESPEAFDALEDDLDAILAEESAADDEIDGSETELDIELTESTGAALGGDVEALLADDGSAEEDELDRLMAEHAAESVAAEAASDEIEFSVDLDDGEELGLEAEADLDAVDESALVVEETQGLESKPALQIDGEDDLEAFSVEAVAPVVEDEEPVGDEALEAMLAAHQGDEASAGEDELDIDALSELTLDDGAAVVEVGAKFEADGVVGDGELVTGDPAQAESSLAIEQESDDLAVGELLEEELVVEDAALEAEPEISLELVDDQDDSDAVVDSLLEGLPEAGEDEANLSVLEAELAGSLEEVDRLEAELSSSEGAAGDLSELVLDDNLDAVADEDLEAELNLMLEQEGNELALDESGLDEALDYLEDADEVGTKLDLARAYVDMDDREGAADILAEVVKEGSEEQVAEAKRMLDSLHAL